ncbi:hypothetical protein EH243_01930 [Amphritea opalescens]|uniref:Uncharacterized protein n=1 Tax=Amphritea opalescens TaxID=2490544 RepID=A0A430KW81_9GAMM|nr:hypothetical protein [Amphritea opalescens]RTE67732.1 hypothetical protein EH243_01930 [Amphritea opalescens]
MDEKLQLSNYCACFIDLLGQKDALNDQSVMPELTTEKEKNDFLNIVRQSVGAIGRLQQQAQSFRQGKQDAYSVRDQLNLEEKELYDEMKSHVAKQQRWSDGLVYYSSLDTEHNKCPMNAVIEIFMLAGTLCFLGLAQKQPIRGAVETAWGVELHENELYGAVVANSYVLESEVAQYPRIVVGEKTMAYLNAHIEAPSDTTDKLALYNRSCAQLCLNMTAIDQDGYHIIDYLGDAFTESVTGSDSIMLFKLAYKFICEQYELHKNNKNSKLELRYVWLRDYFHQHKDKNG